MKTLQVIIGMVALAGLVGMAVQSGRVATFERSVDTASSSVEYVEVTPEWAQDEDAVKAAQDVLRRKELEAQEAELVEQISRLQEELDTVRKDLGTY